MIGPNVRHCYAPMLFAVMAAFSQASAQDCGDWQQRFPPHSPGALAGRAMCYDAARHEAVLLKKLQGIQETWAWDGTTWTVLATGGPKAAGYYALDYDTNRQVVVLFGGISGNTALRETWEWDGHDWTLRAPPGGPSARFWHAMAFDSARGVVVVFGGTNDFEILGDTWEWNGAEWSQVSNSGPSARGLHAMAYDKVRGMTTLFGGSNNDNLDLRDTWAWDGAEWTLLSDAGPQARRGHSMAYDADQAAIVIFGGYTGGGSPLDDTWRWDGGQWSKVNAPNAPFPPRGEASMAFDSSRNAMVLYGGMDVFHNVLSDTWEFSCPPPCYPDLDGDGDLTLFDFLAYVNLFNAGGDTADCDESGSLDLFDFLCFVNAFNEGCG